MDPRVYDTCRNMLVQRGYIVDDESSSTEQLIASKEQEIIYVFFSTVSSFNISHIKEYVSILTEQMVTRAIIVYRGTITPYAKKAIDNLDIRLELFHEDQLKYNLTEHRLVPTHTRLSPLEAKEFKKKYGTNFPTILSTDPVSRFYDFKRGDVIRIDRNGYITYRIVKR